MIQDTNEERRPERRTFLIGMASGSAVVLGSCASSPDREAEGSSEASSTEAEVTPGEDLMQEHGVLERVLLLYGESVRRMDGKEDMDPAVVTQAAGIIRRFVEDYHERNEERHVFPRLEAAKREVALVATLRRQHERGRELTDEIVRLSKAGVSSELSDRLREFERMYRPHAAREDTVVFPAFRSVVGRSAYAELGEQFEDEEHVRLGDHGFEATVAEVARLEATLGIDNLDRFTPP
ncbi:MAG TPA: hemerythrin domain-containing protein [Planctomycetota bacterium]|jgi:hemerythrin-like domain-containing protein|nr:hemerythrin domain-containing protein [Planctomycetota bacterium]